MKTFLYTVALLLASTNASADAIDSLYLLARKGENINITEANKLMTKLDAVGCADTLYEFTSKTPREEMVMVMTSGMSLYCFDTQRYTQAITFGKEALALAKKAGNQEIIGNTYSDIAASYERLGNHELAIQNTLLGIKADSLTGDRSRLSSAFNNLAAICLAAGHKQDAKKYILMAIAHEQSLPNPTKLGTRYGIAAEVYTKLGDYKTAMRYAEDAYKIERKAKNTVGVGRRLAQMADIAVAMKDYHEAETLYRRSVALLDSIGEKHSLAIGCQRLGELMLKEGRTPEAIDFLHRAESISMATGNQYQQLAIFRLLGKAYKDTKPDLAARYLEKALQLQDSLQTERVDRMTAEMSTLFGDGDDEQKKDTPAVWSFLLGALCCGVIVAVVMRKRQQKQQKERVQNEKVLTETAARTTANAAPATPETPTTPEKPKNTGKPATPEKPKNTGKPEKPGKPEKLPLHRVIFNGHVNFDDCSDEERDIILKISDFVSHNIGSGQVNAETIAAHLCMSQSQFSRKINILTGREGIAKFVNVIRTDKAKRLLKSTTKQISDISFECGFNDASYFSQVFKSIYGITPQQYRDLPQEGPLPTSPKGRS